MGNLAHALEVKATEFVAQHAWRYLRPLVSSSLSPRCRHCILSTAFVRLNHDGVCEHCVAHAKAATGARESQARRDDSAVASLDRLLKEAAGRGKGRYDALLLLSGGKDSAYMLHRLRKEQPALRLLCLVVDNGFMSPFALQNVEQVMSHFDVPHIIVKPDPECVHRAFRFALTHLDRQGNYSIVDLVDGQITFDHGRNHASENGIPLLLCGLSRVQLSFVFGITQHEWSAAQERAPLVEKCGVPLSEIGIPEEKKFWFDLNTPPDKTPRVVSPIAAWDPDETTILEEVTRLSLIDRKNSRPLLTNNALIPVIAMAEVARFGYCCWEVEFARMVREGKSERRYWLALFEMLEYSVRTGKFINRNVDRVLARLNLTRADLGIKA